MSKLSRRKGALRFGIMHAISCYRSFCNLECLADKSRINISKSLKKLNIKELDDLYTAISNPAFYNS